MEKGGRKRGIDDADGWLMAFDLHIRRENSSREDQQQSAHKLRTQNVQRKALILRVHLLDRDI
jgi:hypothetical protein